MPVCRCDMPFSPSLSGWKQAVVFASGLRLGQGELTIGCVPLPYSSVYPPPQLCLLCFSLCLALRSLIPSSPPYSHSLFHRTLCRFPLWASVSYLIRKNASADGGWLQIKKSGVPQAECFVAKSRAEEVAKVHWIGCLKCSSKTRL